MKNKQKVHFGGLFYGITNAYLIKNNKKIPRDYLISRLVTKQVPSA